VEKFLQEAKSLARLNHNNITKVISLGQNNGRNYFIMEFVCGNTLYEKLVKEGVFKEKDALQIILQVAEALRHLNQLGIVHRDIKPSNIILTDQNIPKLSDFGIAITQADSEVLKSGLSGTCHYISPEQALQKEVDVRSDIYSLGATLFHILTGETPFDGKEAQVIMMKQITEKLRNPKYLNRYLSIGACQLIKKMMEKESSMRYQSTNELIDAIKNVLATSESAKPLKSRTTRRARVSLPYTRRNQRLLS
jgi:serine/threonine-protein kinase